MAESREELVVRLSDGRALAYAEYGDPRGRPVLYFHSMPGSRLLARAMAGPAEDLGLRVVAPDRPGIGLSDHLPGRKITDWPDDVTGLTEALGIDHFLGVATSNGGPYGLVCAWRMPTRMERLALVSSVCPATAPGVEELLSPYIRRSNSMVRGAPWSVPLTAAFLKLALRRFSDRMLAQLEKESPPSDGAALANPELKNLIVEAGAESVRAGSRGAAQEMRLAAFDWGFSLQEVRVRVELWHGEADTTVTVAVARWLAENLPNCRPHFLPEQGHLLALTHMDEILRDLVAEES